MSRDSTARQLGTGGRPARHRRRSRAAGHRPQPVLGRRQLPHPCIQYSSNTAVNSRSPVSRTLDSLRPRPARATPASASKQDRDQIAGSPVLRYGWSSGHSAGEVVAADESVGLDSVSSPSVHPWDHVTAVPCRCSKRRRIADWRSNGEVLEDVSILPAGSAAGARLGSALECCEQWTTRPGAGEDYSNGYSHALRTAATAGGRQRTLRVADLHVCACANFRECPASDWGLWVQQRSQVSPSGPLRASGVVQRAPIRFRRAAPRRRCRPRCPSACSRIAARPPAGFRTLVGVHVPLSHEHALACSITDRDSVAWRRLNPVAYLGHDAGHKQVARTSRVSYLMGASPESFQLRQGWFTDAMRDRHR